MGTMKRAMSRLPASKTTNFMTRSSGGQAYISVPFDDKRSDEGTETPKRPHEEQQDRSDAPPQANAAPVAEEPVPAPSRFVSEIDPQSTASAPPAPIAVIAPPADSQADCTTHDETSVDAVAESAGEDAEPDPASDAVTETHSAIAVEESAPLPNVESSSSDVVSPAPQSPETEQTPPTAVTAIDETISPAGDTNAETAADPQAVAETTLVVPPQEPGPEVARLPKEPGKAVGPSPADAVLMPVDVVPSALRPGSETICSAPASIQTGTAPPPPFVHTPAAEIATMPVLAPTSKFELNPAAVAPAIVAVRQSASRICDQLRCAATRLLAMNPDGRPQALAITSSLRHEGKSTFCANLGLLLAEGGHRRVVVVDGDLRHGSLAALLGAAKGPGLADLLADAASLDEVVQASSRPNFFVVGAGQSDSRSSSELLSGPRLAQTIADLRARADYVLFDAPSVLDRADGNLIARHCDGAVLVIAGNRTPEPSVMDAVESLRGHGAKILGCVLNGVRNRNGIAHEARD